MQHHVEHPTFASRQRSLERGRRSVRTLARAAIVSAGLVLAFVTPAQALEFDQMLWGFDGRVTPDCFNPLSVLVSNPTPIAFDGMLILQQSIGGNNVDARLVEPVYLSPNSSRWVQFYPYIKYGHESWTLKTSERQSLSVPDPSLGDRAPVMLSDPDDFLQRGGAAKRFPVNLFPPLVGATDGLKAVVLDHVPHWEESRRRAFLDWLHRGGTVHLVQTDAGTFPEFPPAMSILNLQLPEYRVGSGAVFRHAKPARDLNKEFFDSLSSATLVKKAESDGTNASEKSTNAEAVKGETGNQVNTFQQQFEDKMFNDLPDGVFDQLKQLTKPQHEWVVIYLMSLAYIAIIFPGFYILGLKRRDYRLIYGAMVGMIVLFSLAFAWVGRRGYDEATTVHTVALARQVSDGGLDVAGWTNAFVTTGDDYVIDFDGTGKVYSTCQQIEAVNGSITSGTNGQFIVDIPPYSARSFVHRCRAEKGPAATVVAFDDKTQAMKLDVKLGEEFNNQKLIQGLALRKNRFYNAALNDGVLHTFGSAGLTMADIIGKVNQRDFGNYGGFSPFQTEKPANQRYDELFWPLVVRSFDNNSRKELQEIELPDDRVRLFLYLQLPESLQGRLAAVERPGEVTTTHTGCVLYVLDVFPEEKP